MPGALLQKTCNLPSGFSINEGRPVATTPLVPSTRPRRPGSVRPMAVVEITASPPPPVTGTPAGRPVCAAAAWVTVPRISVDSRHRPNRSLDRPSFASSPSWNFLFFTSNRPVPEASDTSVANSPVSLYPM